MLEEEDLEKTRKCCSRISRKQNHPWHPLRWDVHLSYQLEGSKPASIQNFSNQRQWPWWGKGWLVETLNSRHQYNHFCSSQTKTTSQISLEKLSELSSFHNKSDLRKLLSTNHEPHRMRWHEALTFKNLFISYFWLYWIFIAVQELSLVAARGGSPLVTVGRLLIVGPSFVMETGS